MKLRQIGWYWTEPTGLECFGRMADSAVAEAIGADPVYTLSERVQIPPEIEHVAQAVRLELKPGDVVALYINRPISIEQGRRIKAEWETKFPGTRAVVLDGGLTIGAILAGEAP